MTECEATGKNLEQAITNALFELKALREDVDIKIIDQGGFFRKAKVFVKISDDALDKYKKVKKVAETDSQECKPEKSSFEETKSVEDVENVETLKDENIDINSFEDEKNVNEDLAEKEEKTISSNKALKTEKSKKRVDSLDEVSVGKNFLQGMLKVLKSNSNVFVEENENEVFFEIKGDDASNLIGFRGDSLNAIQYLVSIITSKGNRHSKKVRLDIDGFKDRRKESLEALAERIAKKVIKTRHQVKLEPMTAYERRIIHTVIQNYPELESYSTGEEPNRFLSVKIKEENE